MKPDKTTNILLGLIATGVAALTAIAFEQRYHKQLRRMAAGAADAMDLARDRLSGEAQQIGRTVRQETSTLRGNIESGVQALKEKAAALKERVAGSLERAGSRFREEGAQLETSVKEGAESVKDAAETAAEEARSSFQASSRP